MCAKITNILDRTAIKNNFCRCFLDATGGHKLEKLYILRAIDCSNSLNQDYE
ncbi:hypothetical protein SGRA_0067 [Saprospira grandis str. Lewin]|uniref:Uncharacterized protein n=1 Tax=Saprospira grandis (strain Lewin) TaxID=984262 RepID=H6L4D3_SAPGL|nr:hypothetical protein SGRA_0067 [Saprospira grandis str. Lewin]